jgi:hypothetical protein
LRSISITIAITIDGRSGEGGRKSIIRKSYRLRLNASEILPPVDDDDDDSDILMVIIIIIIIIIINA